MEDRQPDIKTLLEREEKRRQRVKRQNDNYNASVDRITFTVPKGEKDTIKQAATAAGFASVNEYISKTIIKDAKRILKKHLGNNL